MRCVIERPPFFCAGGQGLSNYHSRVRADTRARRPAEICAVVSSGRTPARAGARRFLHGLERDQLARPCIPWRVRHVQQPHIAPCQSRQLIRDFVFDRHRSGRPETKDMLAPLLGRSQATHRMSMKTTGVRGYHQSDASSNFRGDRVRLTQHTWRHQRPECAASAQPFAIGSASGAGSDGGVRTVEREDATKEHFGPSAAIH